MYYVVYFWSDNGGHFGIGAKGVSISPLTVDKIISMQSLIKAQDKHDVVTILNIIKMDE